MHMKKYQNYLDHLECQRFNLFNEYFMKKNFVTNRDAKITIEYFLLYIHIYQCRCTCI